MRVDTLAHRKNAARKTEELRAGLNPSFGQRCGRIAFEASMARGDALHLYLLDNPEHAGMAELELKAAEYDLSQALQIVRQLLASVEHKREVQHLQAAE